MWKSIIFRSHTRDYQGPEDCRVTHKLTQQTSRTLGLKTLGFFVFRKENMVNLKRQAEWEQLHTLTKQDLRQMILEKLERATAYYKANQKRETAQGQS